MQRFCSGLLQVWFRSDAGLVQVSFRFCCCSSEWVEVWFRFGSGLMQRFCSGLLQVWFRSDAGLVQVSFKFFCCSSEWVEVWFRFGSGLMQVWFRSVSGLGFSCL